MAPPLGARAQLRGISSQLCLDVKKSQGSVDCFGCFNATLQGMGDRQTDEITASVDYRALLTAARDKKYGIGNVYSNCPNEDAAAYNTSMVRKGKNRG